MILYSNLKKQTEYLRVWSDHTAVCKSVFQGSTIRDRVAQVISLALGAVKTNAEICLSFYFTTLIKQ